MDGVGRFILEHELLHFADFLGYAILRFLILQKLDHIVIAESPLGESSLQAFIATAKLIASTLLVELHIWNRSVPSQIQVIAE